MCDRIHTTLSSTKTDIDLVICSCGTIVVWCFFAWPWVDELEVPLRNHTTICSYVFCFSLFILLIEKSILFLMDKHCTFIAGKIRSICWKRRNERRKCKISHQWRWEHERAFYARRQQNFHVSSHSDTCQIVKRRGVKQR